MNLICTCKLYNLKKAVIGGIVATVVTLPGDKVSDTECKTGYVRVDDACEETCALTPCQELIEIRQKNRFV